MHFSKLLRSCVLASLCLFSTQVFSNLLIHPTRVNLTPENRTYTITVGNTAKVKATYELSWSENRALPDGGYESLDGRESEAVNSASELVRFSPRRVTLQPGERQSVKLLVRRARDLPDGEFRSHLRFKVVPNDTDTAAAKAASTAMKVSVVLNFAIPVALQTGEYNADVSINNAAITMDQRSGNASVTTSLSRQGVHSGWGDIEAYWHPDGGQEILLAKSSGVSFWTEINTLTKQLTTLDNTGFQPQDGRLRVIYRGIGAFSDIVYDEKTFSVTKQDIVVR